MKFIRKILYKTLGLKNYLRLVSKCYIKYIENGLGKEKYPEIHYLKSIINPGFVCIDIGANLGYFSYFLAKLVDRTGKVYAVEPVKLFSSIWKKNLKKFNSKNIILFPYALGSEEKMVEMGMPTIDGVVHHGMTKIVDNNEAEFNKKFDVEMKIPDVLFGELKKIDFIKIDVEGYESIVLENMKQTLIKHKPLIQCELSGIKNRIKSIEILKTYGYQSYILKNNYLVFADKEIIEKYNNDFYFKFETKT